MKTKEKICFFLSISLIACLASTGLGQDSNFDLQNYHIYNAWAALTGRWSLDFAAAEMHTFFSPALDIPYYVLASRLFPTHGALVVALTGIPYAALLYFVLLICEKYAQALCFDTKWERVSFNVITVFLAGTGAATWSQVGTTTNEITLAAIVLAAFYQVLHLDSHGADGESSFRGMAVPGALLGLAAGLKLTAAVYVPPMAIVVFVMAKEWRAGIRNVVFYGVSAFIAFVIAYGPWAWVLYRMTGNPFFPMFNEVFHSNWIPDVSMRDTRFLPRSWAQWVFYPFYWTRLQQGLVTELPFRDVRLALAYIASVAFMLVSVFSRNWRTQLFKGKYRAVSILMIFSILAYVLWLYEFSILRYLVAIECLSSIFIATSVMLLLRRLGGFSRPLLLGCLIVIVGFIVRYEVNPKWGRVPAGTNIFAVQAPAMEKGSLVIFADEPMSYLAKGLSENNQDLHYVGIPQGLAEAGSPGDLLNYEIGKRIQKKIVSNKGGLYILFYINQFPPISSLVRLGVRINFDSCEVGEAPLGPPFFVCRGSYEKVASAMLSKKLKLKVSMLEHQAGAVFDVSLTGNACSDQVVSAEAEIKWSATDVAKVVNIYVGNSSDELKLMAQSGNVGSLKTGRWVTPGTRFEFIDGRADSLARAEIVYEPCKN